MGRLCPRFNAHRMVREYAEAFYLKADAQWSHYLADGAAQVRAVCAWDHWLRTHWSQVRVESVEDKHPAILRVGQDLEVEAQVHPGEIPSHDVVVEFYHGRLGPDGKITSGTPAPMRWEALLPAGRHLYRGEVPCQTNGLHGYAVRIRPRREDGGFVEPVLLFWA